MLPEQYHVCVECGAVFLEPKKYVETHGFDTPPYEEYIGCPICGGSFKHAKYCSNCSNVIVGSYVTINGLHYCDECFTLGSTSIH